MEPPVRIGILGTGRIAIRSLVEPARAIPDVEILSVASREPTRAAEFAAAHRIPGSTSYEGLIADPDIDVVYVTLPNAMHAVWSIRALDAGKHVLCEKPMSANAAEAQQVTEAVERTGRVYLEAMHYVHHPFFRRVREVVDSGALGDLTHVEDRFQIPSKVIAPDNIRLDFALGGGALMDAGCYCLHFLRQLLGEPEAVLTATAETTPQDRQVDVGMTATLAFPAGRTGTVRASFLAGENADAVTTLRGSAGTLEITSIYVPQWGGKFRIITGDTVVEEAADPTPSYVFQLLELVRCVRNGAPVLTSASDGALTMRAVDRIYQSAGLALRGTSASAAPTTESN
jgi:predicted dehydrogenase